MAQNSQTTKLIGPLGVPARVGGAGDLNVALTSPQGLAASIYAQINAYGALRVSPEPTAVFYDPFDGGIDTTNVWVNSGTVFTATTGAATSGAGTTASATSRLRSIPTFSSPGLGFEIFGCVVTVEATPVTNTYRYWGFGTEGGSPAFQGSSAATSTAIANGVGFELDGNGNLYGVIYANGTNVYRSSAIASGTWKDGNPHRYGIFKRTDVVFWYVEGQEVPIAQTSYKFPAVQSQPVLFGQYNNSTAPSASTFNVAAVTVADSTGGNLTISDGTYPFRKASLSPSSTKNALDVNIASTASGMAPVSGTIAATASLTHTSVGNAGNATIVMANGNTTNAVYAFEGSIDGSNWYAIDATRMDGTGVDIQTQPINFATGVVRSWNVTMTAASQFRVRNISGTITTSPAVVIQPGGTLLDFSPVTRDFLSGSNQRTFFTAQATGITTSATDTLLSFAPIRNGTAGTSGTSLTVTAGKTLRIQSFTFGCTQSATATATSVQGYLRYSNGGAVNTSAPIAETIAVTGGSVASGRVSQTIAFGSDGMEFPATYQFGVSAISNVTSGAYFAIIKGYEYT